MDEVAIAFDQGCDARLQGLPRSANPYSKADSLAKTWERGWWDVHCYWGKYVNQRWSYPPLVEVPLQYPQWKSVLHGDERSLQ